MIMSDLQAAEKRRALEVILFSTVEPVSAYQIARLLEEGGWTADDGGITPGQIDKYIQSLILEWENEDRPLTILKIAGGYQMATRPEWSELVEKLQEDKRSHRLSRAALETLAIVAYKQPVIRPDIDAIRGVNSDSSLKTLLEKNLVNISGRDEGPGRPLLYRTTHSFLKYFGLNALNDLPDPAELASLLGVTMDPEDEQEDTGTPEDLFSSEAPSEAMETDEPEDQEEMDPLSEEPPQTDL